MHRNKGVKRESWMQNQLDEEITKAKPILKMQKKNCWKKKKVDKVGGVGREVSTE